LPLSLLPLHLFCRGLCCDASAPLRCFYSASYIPLSCLCCHRSAAFGLVFLLSRLCFVASTLPPLHCYLNSTATALLSVLPLPLSLLPLHLFCRGLCCDASAPLRCLYSASFIPLSCLCCHCFATFDLLRLICSFCSAASVVMLLLRSGASTLLPTSRSPVSVAIALLPLDYCFCSAASALSPLLCRLYIATSTLQLLLCCLCCRCPYLCYRCISSAAASAVMLLLRAGASTLLAIPRYPNSAAIASLPLIYSV
jgi:hypothetical protein